MRVLCVLLLNIFLFAQLGLGQVGLSFWSDAMMNSNSSENRLLASAKFNASYQELLENNSAFDYDYRLLPELTVLSDSLNSFKLISWQIKEDEERFKYHGFLIHKDGKFFKLEDKFTELEDIEYLTLDSKDWLGGIYYNLIQEGEKFYVFSYRQIDAYTKFKSFDVLSFSAEGEPQLGGEDFVFPSSDSRDLVKNRVTFRYSVDAVLSLNYNPDMQMVVHDHLMQVVGRREGQGPTLVPDGTYEGFTFEEKKWIYNEKLFNHTYDEAPRPMQILGNSNKDVFGRERKN